MAMVGNIKSIMVVSMVTNKHSIYLLIIEVIIMALINEFIGVTIIWPKELVVDHHQMHQGGFN